MEVFVSVLNPIRAELKRSNDAQALGVVVRADTPILALCRALVGAGHDPDQRLDCYRNGTALALTVGSIGQGARLTVKSVGNGAPTFAIDRGPRGAGASPVRADSFYMPGARAT